MDKPNAKFKDRLSEALSSANMKPIELSTLSGIPKSSISQYLSGYATPKSDRTYKIAKVLNVNPVWLMGYDVPMVDEAPEPTLDEQLEGVEFALWGEVQDLSDDEKQDVLDCIKFTKSQRKENR